MSESDVYNRKFTLCSSKHSVLTLQKLYEIVKYHMTTWKKKIQYSCMTKGRSFDQSKDLWIVSLHRMLGTGHEGCPCRIGYDSQLPLCRHDTNLFCLNLMPTIGNLLCAGDNARFWFVENLRYIYKISWSNLCVSKIVRIQINTRFFSYFE